MKDLKTHNMSKKEKKLAWEKHYSAAKEKEFYAIKRIDLLTISISGACIYIVFEILRFLNGSNNTNIDSCVILLKISAISAVIAIAVNFLSQIFGYKANKYEAKYSREIINQIGEKEDETKLHDIDIKSKHYDSLTFISNVIATIFMALGISLLVIYNLFTF